jgi:Cu2+-exporting ATPase
MVRGLGLDSYYRRRVLDSGMRAIRPDSAPPRFDFAPYVTALPGGDSSLTLAIDGLHCAACVWFGPGRPIRKTWWRVSLHWVTG